jgi:hypothetical protein
MAMVWTDIYPERGHAIMSPGGDYRRKKARPMLQKNLKDICRATEWFIFVSDQCV